MLAFLDHYLTSIESKFLQLLLRNSLPLNPFHSFPSNFRNKQVPSTLTPLDALLLDLLVIFPIQCLDIPLSFLPSLRRMNNLIPFLLVPIQVNFNFLTVDSNPLAITEQTRKKRWWVVSTGITIRSRCWVYRVVVSLTTTTKIRWRRRRCYCWRFRRWRWCLLCSRCIGYDRFDELHVLGIRHLSLKHIIEYILRSRWYFLLLFLE